VNKYFVGILHSWIALPTNNTKLTNKMISQYLVSQKTLAQTSHLRVTKVTQNIQFCDWPKWRCGLLRYVMSHPLSNRTLFQIVRQARFNTPIISPLTGGVSVTDKGKSYDGSIYNNKCRKRNRKTNKQTKNEQANRRTNKLTDITERNLTGLVWCIGCWWCR